MQTWALQQVLIKMGHKPVLLNRRKDCPRPSEWMTMLRCLVFVKYFFLKIFGIEKGVRFNSPFVRDYSPMSKGFGDMKFVNECIRKTHNLYDSKSLQHEVNKKSYSAFIVGSDQVWREEYAPRIENYFFDILDRTDSRPRIAYGASFGISQGYISEDKIDVCRDLLDKFKAVSYRESEGGKILRNVFKRADAIHVLDPTQLLSADEYRKLIRSHDKIATQRYVGAYILDNNEEKEKIITSVEQSLSLPIRRMGIMVPKGSMPTVSQWLALFDQADFVVTDSFHGCVFSIIFQKPFIAIANKERGIDRFLTLLDGIEDRLIYSYEDFIKYRGTLMHNIDYDNIRPIFDSKRKASIDFLKNALA